MLGSLADSFPSFKSLAGLATLRSTDDVDLDFFENMRHIQLHRRSRALNRLCLKLTGYITEGKRHVCSHGIQSVIQGVFFMYPTFF